MRQRLGIPALWLAACASPGAATTDAAIDAAPFTPPGSVTLRVRNDGARTLYVQASGWSGQEVTTVRRPGGGVIGRDTCEICNCDGCPSCAVCGRGLAQVAELVPGATFDVAWDQTEWTVVEEGCRPTLACERAALVPPGPLIVTAEFSDTFETTTMFGPMESFIGERTRVDHELQHPATGVVIVSIE